MTSHPHVPYLRRRKCRSKFKDLTAAATPAIQTNVIPQRSKESQKKRAALTFKTASLVMCALYEIQACENFK